MVIAFRCHAGPDRFFSSTTFFIVLVKTFLHFCPLIQLDTIQQLQRLYEDLIENEEDCQLDRYKSSEKEGR
jgi:hypothetical protein